MMAIPEIVDTREPSSDHCSHVYPGIREHCTSEPDVAVEFEGGGVADYCDEHIHLSQ